MKKVLEILEKNVQWLALAIGVLYVLWMAYTYVIQKPVVVKIGNDELRPGEVDRFIVNNAANDLQQRMNNPANVPMNPPEWKIGFQDALANKGQTAVAFGTLPFPFDKTQTVTFAGPGPRPVDVFVESLPKLPPAKMAESRTGRSTVAIPNQVAAKPAGEAVVLPVAQNDGGGVDKHWVTVKYTIPMVELAAAFRDVKIPFEQYQTSVVAAELWRQEQLPDGSWGPEKKIAPLPNVALQPLPNDKASVSIKTQFLDWANQNAVSILQPPFYTILAGDPWSAPGQVIPVVVEEPKEEVAFDPLKYLDATPDVLMTLTPEQRRLVAQAKAKKAEEERKAKGGNKGGGKTGGGTGGKGGGGGLGGGVRGPNDDGRPTDWQSDGRDDQPTGEQTPQDPAAQPAAATAPGDMPIPNGAFDPRNTADAFCWAHDDTIEAGKTYRYRVVYTIKSPVWNTTGVTKPPELANTFVLVSPKDQTEWSEPVSMESLTKFFVTRQNFKGDAVEVHVFRWSGGQLQTRKFDVAPGDAVGRLDNGIDFSTGWTLVDMRTDPRTEERFAVLMDQQGKLFTRDFRRDANDPEFKKMSAEAAAAADAGGSDAVAGSR